MENRKSGYAIKEQPVSRWWKGSETDVALDDSRLPEGYLVTPTDDEASKNFQEEREKDNEEEKKDASNANLTLSPTH